MGVCSYLLIGFWHSKPSAAAAAKKAFLVNRVGDVGFAIAIFWMWTAAGHDISYDHILGSGTIKTLGSSTAIGIGLLLLWAATAKSAQVPLYVWLPDAMEGPTPVSALIHAATMVTAGVYLLARSAPLVYAEPVVPLVICSIGAITALLAGLDRRHPDRPQTSPGIFHHQQLGYMFMALGAGVGDVMFSAAVAAMFHLFTHAFFKALLFLGSGSVMHAMGGVLDMRRFRGLRHRLPQTHLTFLIGALSLAGLVPLAGFWSKDEILSALHRAAEYSETDLGGGTAATYYAIYWVAVVTAGLTAFYTFRAYFLTFWGPEKLPQPDDPNAPEVEPAAVDDHGHGHDSQAHGDGHDSHFGHESPPVMTAALDLCRLHDSGRLVFGPLTGLFEGHLERTATFAGIGAAEAHGLDWLSISVGTLAAVLGIGVAYALYFKPSPAPAAIARRFGPLDRASRGKFYIDEIYDAIVVKPVRLIASISRFVDTYFVHGLVRLTAWIPRIVGRDLLGPFQNGLIQFYAGASALGVAGLLLYLLLS